MESVDSNPNRIELFLEIDRSAALFIIEEAEWLELKDLALEKKRILDQLYCNRVALPPHSSSFPSFTTGLQYLLITTTF